MIIYQQTEIVQETEHVDGVVETVAVDPVSEQAVSATEDLAAEPEVQPPRIQPGIEAMADALEGLAAQVDEVDREVPTGRRSITTAILSKPTTRRGGAK